MTNNKKLNNFRTMKRTFLTMATLAIIEAYPIDKIVYPDDIDIDLVRIDPSEYKMVL